MTCIDNDEEKVLVYVIKMHKHIYKFKIKVRGKKGRTNEHKIDKTPSFKIKTI